MRNAVKPRFIEPLYNEVLGIVTNDIFQAGNGVMYRKKPRYNEPISPVPRHFVKSRFHCKYDVVSQSISNNNSFIPSPGGWRVVYSVIKFDMGRFNPYPLTYPQVTCVSGRSLSVWPTSGFRVQSSVFRVCHFWVQSSSFLTSDFFVFEFSLLFNFLRFRGVDSFAGIHV